jgi:hypothetical protein
LASSFESREGGCRFDRRTWTVIANHISDGTSKGQLPHPFVHVFWISSFQPPPKKPHVPCTLAAVVLTISVVCSSLHSSPSQTYLSHMDSSLFRSFFFLDECQIVCGIRCRINTPAHNTALLKSLHQFESKRRTVDVDNVIMMKKKIRQMLAAPWTSGPLFVRTQVSPPPTYVAVHPGSRVTHAAAPRVTSARARDAASAGVPALVHRITTPVIASC